MRKISLVLVALLLFFTCCNQPERSPDEVRIRLATEPETLSPVSYSDAGGLQVINLLFQSLLSADLATDQMKPFLANRMPIVERQDSVTLFTYELREEASWADGSPVTAADVAFTLKVLKAPLLNNEQLRPQVAFIQDISVSPENPKRFTLVAKGYTPEMELLTGDFFILPAYLFDPDGLMKSVAVKDLNGDLSELENNDNLKRYAAKFNTPDFGRNPALLQGSGGYVLEKWANGQYLTLKRKDDWWGNTTANTGHLTANPERITFQIIPENTTALLALKNRQLDVLDNISADEFEDLRKDKSFLQEYALYTPDAYEFVYAGINTRLPKFSDKRTRQAIAHLLDVNSVIKVSQQNYATPTVGPVPPSVKAYYNNNLQPYPLNTAKATELLKAAGWEREPQGWFKNINGKRVQLTLTVNYRAGNTTYENAAIILQQHAAELGIPVQVQGLENSLLSDKLKSHDFDLFFRSLSGNPFVFNFQPLFHTSFAGIGGPNYTGVGTPESDRLLLAINETADPAEKAKLLKRLQEVLYEEAAFISMYYQKERLAAHRRFENLHISGLKPNYDVSAFRLKE